MYCTERSNWKNWPKIETSKSAVLILKCNIFARFVREPASISLTTRIHCFERPKSTKLGTIVDLHRSSSAMGLHKAEIKLRRLLAALPEQTNEVKLKHYLATAREQLLILTAEDAENLTRITPAKTKEYADRIDTLAEKLDMRETLKEKDSRSNVIPTAVVATSGHDGHRETSGVPALSSKTDSLSLSLRRNVSKGKEPRPRLHGDKQRVDTETHMVLERHRQLQEDLTDEMVLLARQIKETSLLMDHSLRDTEKVVDSTERAVEQSLAATAQANLRAGEIYSRSFTTTCFSCLMYFFMFSMFMFMVLLIRLT